MSENNSNNINPAPPGKSNFYAVSPTYNMHDDLSYREALRQRISDNHDPWVNSNTVITISASRLPSAEDNIKKLRERHPDLIESTGIDTPEEWSA